MTSPNPIGYDTPEAAIAAAEKNAEEKGHVEFEGHNCADLGRECSGWNGWSSRCECGNRRVDWFLGVTSLEGKEKLFTAHAEAY